MARNDGIDRISARNVNLTAAKIGNAQRHNEREKKSYTNPDIIPERPLRTSILRSPPPDMQRCLLRWKKTV